MKKGTLVFGSAEGGWGGVRKGRSPCCYSTNLWCMHASSLEQGWVVLLTPCLIGIRYLSWSNKQTQRDLRNVCGINPTITAGALILFSREGRSQNSTLKGLCHYTVSTFSSLMEIILHVLHEPPSLRWSINMLFIQNKILQKSWRNKWVCFAAITQFWCSDLPVWFIVMLRKMEKGVS